METIKLLKKYTYTSICNIDFNVLIYFDYDNETLLYSLKYEDDSSSGDYLVEYAASLNDDEINSTIKSFMLDYVWSQINSYINENNYSGWKVWITDSGWKLANESKNIWKAWNIYDDEDYEVIQSKLKKFLDWNNQHNKQ